MLRYYFVLGVRNLRRNPALTALMILTLAVGVAASISTLTILHVMSGDPIPHRSARLLVPMIDAGQASSYVPGAPPDDNQLTYRDAINLLNSGQGVHRTAVFRISVAIEPPRPDMPVEASDGIAVTSDYFAIFEPPFLHGGAWSDAEDRTSAQVVVLGRRTSEKIFGHDNPVGRQVRMYGQDFKVIGVLDQWHPMPRYTHLVNSPNAFSGEDEIFIPFSTAIRMQATSNGSSSCSGDRNPGYQGFLDSECTWIQFWFEVKSVADRPALLEYVSAYVAEQRRLGRLQRQAPVRLFDVREWMEYLQVISKDTHLAVWLSFGFLLLCLVNTVGLLLAKFSVRAPEVGVRRALGATQGAIFRQFLVEAAVVGLAGGFAGLVLSVASLGLIAQQSRTLSMAAQMDWSMLALTFALALVSSLLAGVLPTWRACQVTPALQLKSQ